MNVSGLTYSDDIIFSSVVLSLLNGESQSSLPFTTLDVNVNSMSHIVNGQLIETVVLVSRSSNLRRLVDEDPYADYMSVNYVVSVTTFDSEFSEHYCLDLLSNVTQFVVDGKVLDDRLSSELNKAVVVLSVFSLRGGTTVTFNTASPSLSPSLSPPNSIRNDNTGTTSSSSYAVYLYVGAAFLFLLLFFVCLFSFRSRMVRNLGKKYNSSRSVIFYDEDEFNDADNSRYLEDFDESSVSNASFEEPNRNLQIELSNTQVLGADSAVDLNPDPLQLIQSSFNSYELDERVLPDFERFVMPALRQKLSSRRATLDSEEQLSPRRPQSSFGEDDTCRLEDVKLDTNLSTTQDNDTEEEDSKSKSDSDQLDQAAENENSSLSDDERKSEESKSDAEGGAVILSPFDAVTI